MTCARSSIAGNATIFSRALRQALSETLERGEQAILFINRRGTATCVTCRHCGHVVSCRRCDIPLVYHQTGEALVCHRCNRRRPRRTLSRPVPVARSGTLASALNGLNRSCELHTRPRESSASIATLAVGGVPADLWDRFRAHEIDVLVGTQLVTKALDFPLVTLVGVVLADVGPICPISGQPSVVFSF